MQKQHIDDAQYYFVGFFFQWKKLPLSFKSGKQEWGFVPPSKGLDGAPITLRTGDYNLDGFLDVLGVLQTPDDNGLVNDFILILSICVGKSHGY